jgi:hypothetical protein
MSLARLQLCTSVTCVTSMTVSWLSSERGVLPFNTLYRVCAARWRDFFCAEGKKVEKGPPPSPSLPGSRWCGSQGSGGAQQSTPAVMAAGPAGPPSPFLPPRLCRGRDGVVRRVRVVRNRAPRPSWLPALRPRLCPGRDGVVRRALDGAPRSTPAVTAAGPAGPPSPRLRFTGSFGWAGETPAQSDCSLPGLGPLAVESWSRMRASTISIPRYWTMTGLRSISRISG